MEQQFHNTLEIQWCRDGENVIKTQKMMSNIINNSFFMSILNTEKWSELFEIES